MGLTADPGGRGLLGDPFISGSCKDTKLCKGKGNRTDCMAIVFSCLVSGGLVPLSRSECIFWPFTISGAVFSLVGHHRSPCIFPGRSSQVSPYFPGRSPQVSLYFSWPLITGLTVYFRLPDTVYFSEEPQVVIWDPIRKLWSLDGFSDHDFREGENRTPSAF